jgi:hypothetical protein
LFVAALLYGCSLLLIPLSLSSAVFALLAALVCLPAVRAELFARAGIRVDGLGVASAVTLLILFAVLSAGGLAEGLDSSANFASADVVSISPGTKP